MAHSSERGISRVTSLINHSAKHAISFREELSWIRAEYLEAQFRVREKEGARAPRRGFSENNKNKISIPVAPR